jgi:hypothetical protein
VLHGTYPAAITERHAAFRREPSNQRVVRFGAGRGGVDIENYYFVNFLLVKYPNRIDRVAYIFRRGKPLCFNKCPFMQK